MLYAYAVIKEVPVRIDDVAELRIAEIACGDTFSLLLSGFFYFLCFFFNLYFNIIFIYLLNNNNNNIN